MLRWIWPITEYNLMTRDSRMGAYWGISRGYLLPHFFQLLPKSTVFCYLLPVARSYLLQVAKWLFFLTRSLCIKVIGLLGIWDSNDSGVQTSYVSEESLTRRSDRGVTQYTLVDVGMMVALVRKMVTKNDIHCTWCTSPKDSEVEPSYIIMWIGLGKTNA